MNPEHLEAAVQQAKESYSQGGLPIGAAFASDSKLLATGHNQREQNKDAVAHAELDCLRAAGLVDAETYANSTLYSSLSPCWMCAGAIRLYGIRKVVIADEALDVVGQERWRADDAFYQAAGIEFIVHPHQEMIDLFRRFLRESPEKWSGDVGGT